MTDQNIDTKKKIMDAARILFAEHGFDGTSIRDIAKNAEVNVASINYHFSNKENLFAEILNSSYVECANEVKKFFEEFGNLEETLVAILRYYLDHSHDLLTHFKMMMSTQHNHHLSSKGTDDAFYGPPGGMIIAEAIKKEVGKPLTDENVHWGLKTLYSHVGHIAIIHTCCLKTNPGIPFSEISDLEKGVRRLTRVVLLELKNS